MLNGLVTALRTLTILPVPGRDAERMTDALPWFPAVGLLLGTVQALLGLLVLALTRGQWPEGAAVIALMAGLLLTRALHVDGLADWADGFWGARARERVLEIMKDPRSGSFGVAAVATMLLAKWVAMARLLGEGSAEGILVAAVVSRAMQVELASSHPYARPEGGTGAAFIGAARPRHFLAAAVLAAGVLTVLPGNKPLAGTALFLGWLLARAFGGICQRRVGGVTGDLLGAGSELIETALLLFVAGVNTWNE